MKMKSLKIKNQNDNVKFKIFHFKLSFSILIFTFLIIAFPQNAEASFLINRPLYIGLTNGLVGYWSFNGMDMAATTAFDKSGQNNNGTLTNGPVRSEGKIGQALSFDGLDDKIDFGNPSTLDVSTTAWSFSLWFKTSSTGAYQFLLGKSQTAVTQSWEVRITNGNVLQTNWYDNLNNDFVTGTTVVTDGRWHNVAVTRQGGAGGTITLWLDGKSEGTTSETPRNVSNSYSVTMGTDGRAPGIFPYTGLIDEVRVYNRALSVDEIKRLYKMGATNKINVPRKDTLKEGLVGSWTFDGPDMAATTAFDKSGQNNNGTLTNGPVRTEGKISQALSFDGVDDVVQTGTVIGPQSAYSASVWMKPSTVAGAVLIIGMWTTGGNSYTQFYRSGTSICARINQTDSIYIGRCAASAVTAGEWKQAMMTWSGGTTNAAVKIFINGVQVDNSDDGAGVFTAPGAGAVPRNIGAQGGGVTAYSNFFNGLIDDVRIYNRALSVDEIKRLYKMGATNKINVPRKDTLKEGLVGSWTFDGPDMAATTAFDKSGQNNNGTLTNGPVRTEGKIGQALSFDGVNDYVNLGSASILDGLGLGSFTASAWMNPRTVGDTAGRIFDKRPAGGSGGWLMNMNNVESSSITGTIVTNTGASNATSRGVANSITFNSWNHVVMTYSDTAASRVIRLYVNGVEVTYSVQTASAATTGSDADGNLLVGDDSTLIRSFDGKIDDVRIYNRALTEAEIKRLYNMGR